MAYAGEPRPVFDARMAIHAALSAVMGWLGFVLILPGSTFDGNPAWRIFASMGAEDTWALSFWLVACAGLIGLTTAMPSLRLFCVIVLSTAHGTVALLFLFSNPAGGASGTYAVLAGLGYYLVFRRAHQGV